MIRANSDKDESAKQSESNARLPLVRHISDPESPVNAHYVSKKVDEQNTLMSRQNARLLYLVGRNPHPIDKKPLPSSLNERKFMNKKGMMILNALDKAVQQNITRWAKKMHETVLRTAISHYSTTINELDKRVIEEKNLTENELKLHRLIKKFDAKALIPPLNQYVNLSEAEKKLLFLAQKAERDLLQTPAPQKDKSKKFKA